MAFRRNVQLYTMGYGAGNVAYLPNTTLPLRNVFGIGAILPTFHWQVIQPEQFWVNPILRVIGNPGVTIGTMIGQPMIDTRGINGA